MNADDSSTKPKNCNDKQDHEYDREHDHDRNHPSDHSHDHHGDHHHRHSHHHHDHGHSHHHFDTNSANSAVFYAFSLNLVFCIVEAIGGYHASSQAIMADALHDFGDSLSLLALLGLRWLSKRTPGSAYSYGYRRLNILGATIVGLTLVTGSILILGSSLPKILNPKVVHGPLMLALSVLGIAVNGASFLRLKNQGGIGENLVRLHLLEDLWGWIIVAIGALAIYFFGWNWLDPLLSVFLAFFILWRSLQQIKELGRLMLLGAGQAFDRVTLAQKIKDVGGVMDVHHLHVWELDSGFHVITAHVVVKEEVDTVVVKNAIRASLLKIGKCEVTIEIEVEGEDCLDPLHPVEF